ncbi:unnamed protein product [Nippostrongylus brasiliensis]|uniref:BON domain-containing protein n=1 Tax=Nippostrongylus brasiliensis TaxID=27835 RepID=A0A158R2T5_NIPBR|nr:unnamed protein product [Nippostrongylus brasiliensis]
MPSADLAKSQFKYQGVLKLHGEVGDIKHALDEASSRSLEQINFDPSHNELVVIGSAVENIELASEDVSSARDPKSSASKVNVGKKQAQKVSASAEKLPSVGSSREALAAEADPSLVVANVKSSTTVPNTTVSQPNSRESSSASVIELTSDQIDDATVVIMRETGLELSSKGLHSMAEIGVTNPS